MSNLSKFLIREFTEESSKRSIKFFRRAGPYGYIIWLSIISHYQEKLINICSQYASRRTVIDFINKSCEMGYTLKIGSLDDKRKVRISPSRTTLEEYNQWSEYFISNVK